MDEILQAIVAALTSGNGTITWDDFVNALPERERARAYNWARQMESQGVGRRQVVMTENGPVFSIVATPPNGGG